MHLFLSVLSGALSNEYAYTHTHIHIHANAFYELIIFDGLRILIFMYALKKQTRNGDNFIEIH